MDAGAKRRSWSLCRFLSCDTSPGCLPVTSYFLKSSLLRGSGLFKSLICSSRSDFHCCPPPARENAPLVRSSRDWMRSAWTPLFEQPSSVAGVTFCRGHCFGPHSGGGADTRARAMGWGVSFFEFCVLHPLRRKKNPKHCQLDCGTMYFLK